MTWNGLSVFGLFLGLVAALMLIPAALSLALEEPQATAGATAFGASAALTAFAAGLLILAQRRVVARSETVGEFSTLLAIFFLAPVAAAIPIKLLAPYLPAEAAYFEMVSTFTTTGATVFERLVEVHPAIILWRALTAWLGGFVALVMAFALMAPRNIGGFEVRGSQARTGAIGRLRGAPEWAGGRGREAAADRVADAIRLILPVYVALTVALAVILMAFGQTPFRAVVAAIGVISTSGVKATDDPVFLNPGYGAEFFAAVFLILAATRRTYGAEGRGALNLRLMREDAELRILLIVVAGVAGWLYLRHFIGALDLGDGEGASIAALWGALFTALSFATTTGYESASWEAARAWSGLSNPSLVLFGLAIMGGGVATTAGGVKLLRAYALFNHGAREMERLVQPSSISGSGARKRGLRREGAQIAWVFVMLFLVAMIATMLSLSLTGLSFERSLAASIAAMTNTGPLFAAVDAGGGGWLLTLTAEARAICVVAMVMGRVELLALIAMLNPDYWR